MSPIIKRSNNKSRHKLKIASSINNAITKDSIKSFFLNKTSNPHCLIQLSKTEYQDLRENSVHVCGINNSDKKMIRYEKITHVGSNLHLKDKDYSINGISTKMSMVNISKVKKRVFSITCSVKDVLSVYPETIIIASTLSFL